MKKRAFSIILVLLLFAFSSVSVFAATSNNSRIDDRAGLISSSDLSSLEKQLKDASSKGKMDVVVITVNGIPEGKSAQDYADDLYDSLGYAKDGILLLVSVAGDDRDYAISTAGRAIEAFNQGDINSIEKNVKSYLQKNDYSGAISEFADSVQSAKSFRFGLWAGIAAAVGGLAGLIRSGSMKSELKSVKSKTEAKDYIKQGSFILDKQFDIPTFKTYTRTKISTSSTEKQETHVSSSGVTHGGTSGKF